MKTRLLALVLVLGVGAIAIGWVYESQIGSDQQTTTAEIPDNVDFYLTNMSMRTVDNQGALDFVLDSPRLEHHQRDDVSQIDQPRLQIYRSTDRWNVQAGLGHFEHSANLLRLRRDVVMRRTGASSFELRTEQIRFEPDLNLIATEARVSMLQEKSRIEAERAVFDLAGGIYHLTGAKATYQP